MAAIMDLGPHAGFIWSSYGAVVLVVGALIIWVVADGRRQRTLLAELEAQGMVRRSAATGSKKSADIDARET